MTNNADQATTFVITDTKICGPVVNIQTQDNAELAWTIKSWF